MATTAANNLQPGVGANDNVINAAMFRSLTANYGFGPGNPIADIDVFTNGFLYTESGIADPAGTDAWSAASGMVIDASQDASSNFDTDTFLYCDSTDGNIKLHVGTLNGANAYCQMFLVLQELPFTDLGAL